MSIVLGEHLCVFDHEILCFLYRYLTFSYSLSPTISYILIILLVTPFVQNINQGAREAIISMGKEDSHSEEDSFKKQVRWFFFSALGS